MSANVKKTGPFDVKTVESLVALMAANDLSEIYLKDGGQQVRLRRGSSSSYVLRRGDADRSSDDANGDRPPIRRIDGHRRAKKNLLEIKSETVGTFYTQAKPGEPPYAKVGDRVTPNKVVGLVEVMKTYSEIQANCTGTIVEVCIENGKYVEFGEVLFRVDPS